MAVTGQDLPGLGKARPRGTAPQQRRRCRGPAGRHRRRGRSRWSAAVQRLLGAHGVFGRPHPAASSCSTSSRWRCWSPSILYLNQWRAGLIDARVQSLRVQGEIIAAAIAASATVDSDVIQVDPQRLLQLKGGDAVSPLSYYDPNLEFPINPEQVAPLLRNLVTPTRTRARIYDQSGFMILDSASIYMGKRRGDPHRQ